MEDYQIVELIAQGGYGIVLKALQKSTGQLVAIKQFRDSDPLSLKIAQREISVLKLMNGHPNIIQLLNSFQHNQKVFLVFEIMQQTLLEHIQKQPEGKLEREQVRYLVFQMVQALEYMHSQNAVHRDIKPENMLIQQISQIENKDDASQNKISKRRGSSLNPKLSTSNLQDEGVFVLKVCDFGQSKQINHQDVTLTEYVSTRWYRAPELLVGSKNYDKSIDIWALGCMVPELISGKPLFPGNTNYEALAYVLKTLGNNLTQEQVSAFSNNPQFEQYGKVPLIRKIIPLEKRVAELTEEEVDFVSKCLQIDPRKRMSAKDLLNHPYLIQFKGEKFIPNISKENMLDQKQENISERISEESENIKESSDSETNALKQSHQSDNNHQDVLVENNKKSQGLYRRKESNYSRGKKIKKRPTSQHQSNNNASNSSGTHNSQQQNKETHQEKQPTIEHSRNSNQESSHSNLNSGQNQKRKDQQPKQEENLLENQNSTPLPRPILFLRKQKDAMQNVEKDLPKGFNKLGLPDEALGNYKDELIIENPHQTIMNQNIGNDYKNYEFGPEVKSSSTTINKQNTLNKYYEQQINPSYNKKQNLKTQVVQKNTFKEQSFNKGSNNQLKQIPKNQILFIAQKNSSPPVKSNNQKIVMVNQIEQQANNYKINTFQKYQKRPSIQQEQARNVSMPHQQYQQQFVSAQDEYQVPKLSSKMFLQQDKVQSYSPNSFQGSKKKDYLPKLIKERRLEEKMKAQNQLLNTEKHVTSKLQLPAINKNGSIKHEKEKSSMIQHSTIARNIQQQREQEQSLHTQSRTSTTHEVNHNVSNHFLRLASQNQDRTAVSNNSSSPHQMVDRQRITQQFPSSHQRQFDTQELRISNPYVIEKSPMSNNGTNKNLFSSNKAFLQTIGTNYAGSLNGRMVQQKKK